jgi:UDP-N-acetylmuramoyl-L-alanyl-D-glutamate--2,6-diaminopimelate ligase
VETIYKKNSNNIKNGDVFFSIKGKHHNGNNFIIEALNKGAKKIIIQKDNPISEELLKAIQEKNADSEYVEDIYQRFAEENKRFYGIKEEDFIILGVTGTKGKTTTANCLFLFLQTLGLRTGLMSSVRHTLNHETFEHGEKLTTEMADVIYHFLYQAKQRNITHIVLEVSSQAFAQKRVWGITFTGFIFTNFSQEHGETHRTQKDYFLAKCELYKQVKEHGHIVLNLEDKKVSSSKKYKQKNQTIHFFSQQKHQENYYEIIDETILKTTAKIIIQNKSYMLESSWTGSYNIENIFASIMLINGIKKLKETEINLILNQTKILPQIPGRNERYQLQNGTIIAIEKAPTANSVLQTVQRLRSFTKDLIVVFGCGGNRDKKKRKLLAKIIEQHADTVFVSMDNPRFENLNTIFQDISRGFTFSKNIFFISDRANAINEAIKISKKNSIVALLGKGDETYQEIKGIKYPFSEKEIIQSHIAK